MDECVMKSEALSEWNPSQKPPLASWLATEKYVLYDERMLMLGNIVLPRCARLGMHLLLHSIRSHS